MDGSPPTAGIVPLVQEVLIADSVFLHEIGVIIMPKGPTSFTTQRIMSTMAKSIKFVASHCSVFAPSQFHVIAFAGRNFIPEGQRFLVVLNSYNCGFFGAVFENRECKPKMVNPASYYDKKTGFSFIDRHADIPFVTDFSKKSLDNVLFSGLNKDNQVQLPDVNLAEMQIDLYESSVRDEGFDYASFQPYCLDTPMYRKTA
jgi:tRNA A37 threonylcarbamoyladenosine modification protein TsaB